MMNNAYQKATGTTLIEALVAAIIIGVGLLGIATLQMKALQASSNAEYRARATDIAWDLSDRIRANQRADNTTNAADGNYYISAAIATCPTGPSKQCAMKPGGDASSVASCTPREMAAFDLYEIRCNEDIGVKAVLPGGALTVTCDDVDTSNTDTCDPGSELLITVSWQTRNDVLDTGSRQESITMSVVPGGDPGY